MTGTMDGALESSGYFGKMWKGLVEDFGGKIDEQEGVLIRWSGFSLFLFNVITFDDAKVDRIQLKKRLEFGADFMRKRKEIGMFPIFEQLLTEDARSNLQESYEKVGLVRVSKEFGMAGYISTLQEPYHPDLRFERVTTQKGLDNFGIINARAHKIDPSGFTDNLSISTFWKEIGHVYIGFSNKDGQPVCCAATFPIEKSLFLLGVATDPNYWRHGYGEAITRKALYEGGKANQLDRVVFQSTEIGRPVYERIGMKVTCHIHTLMLQGEE